MESNQQSSPVIPIAIIIGFAMIALAIFFTRDTSTTETVVSNTDINMVADETAPRTVNETDFIRGNPNAPIMLVEYSDYDCPYCKQYHETMNQIMKEYGVNGQVAWTYRQFPLAQLHPNSPKISESALCVGDIGGNDAFWKFTDLIFDQRTLEAPTNVTRLQEYAETAGISIDDFENCLASQKKNDHLRDDIRSALNSGAQGTPFTVIMVGNQQEVISGAQSYEFISTLIDNLIDQLDGDYDTSSTTLPDSDLIAQ